MPEGGCGCTDSGPGFSGVVNTLLGVPEGVAVSTQWSPGFTEVSCGYTEVGPAYPEVSFGYTELGPGYPEVR